MTSVLSRSDLICWEREKARIIVAPGAGRVLQVEVDGHAAFWTDPSAAGWNIGGDRLWLGPEAAWFWTTALSYDHRDHIVQAPLDPGTWSVASQRPEHLVLINDAELRHLPSGTTSAVQVTQAISGLDLELPLFRHAIAYAVDSRLRRISGQATDGLCLWRSLQVPTGGEIHAPCFGRPAYRDYFDPAPGDHWERTDTEMIFRITGRQRFKVGLAPHVTTGRTVYVRGIGTEHLVILQQFAPQPWRRYSDGPRGHDGNFGDAVQVYNDGGQFGNYGEMEHLSPALDAGHECEVTDSTITVVGTVAAEKWEAWEELWLSAPGWPVPGSTAVL
jgi:hypothetical protein